VVCEGKSKGDRGVQERKRGGRRREGGKEILKGDSWKGGEKKPQNCESRAKGLIPRSSATMRTNIKKKEEGEERSKVCTGQVRENAEKGELGGGEEKEFAPPTSDWTVRKERVGSGELRFEFWEKTDAKNWYLGEVRNG